MTYKVRAEKSVNILKTLNVKKIEKFEKIDEKYTQIWRDPVKRISIPIVYNY